MTEKAKSLNYQCNEKGQPMKENEMMNTANHSTKEYEFKNLVIKVNSFFLEDGKSLETKLENLILKQARENVA